MIRSIVIAVDGSEHGAKALAWAAELARKHEARIVLTHCLLHGTAIGELYAISERLGFADAVKADLEAAEAATVETAALGGSVLVPIVPDSILRKVGDKILEYSARSVGGPPPQVDTRISDGDAADAIIECAQQAQADLVVIGSRGLGRVAGLFLGSVSQKVLQSVTCACLIVK